MKCDTVDVVFRRFLKECSLLTMFHKDREDGVIFFQKHCHTFIRLDDLSIKDDKSILGLFFACKHVAVGI